jgi:hypothetical protein
MRRARPVPSEGTTRVFISATSKDLGTVRDLVKQALLTMGCMPIEQTNFPPDYRSVHEMIEEKIAGCEAVIHIVGIRYGAEPDRSTLPEGAARRSYMQMEADIARKLGKNCISSSALRTSLTTRPRQRVKSFKACNRPTAPRLPRARFFGRT